MVAKGLVASFCSEVVTGSPSVVNAVRACALDHMLKDTMSTCRGGPREVMLKFPGVRRELLGPRVCLWLSFPRFLPGLTGRPVEDSRHSQQTKIAWVKCTSLPRATRGGTPIAQLVRRLLGELDLGLYFDFRVESFGVSV